MADRSLLITFLNRFSFDDKNEFYLIAMKQAEYIVNKRHSDLTDPLQI